MKNFLMNCLNAGNFVLHLILGAGIIMLFLKWERDFVGILVMGFLIPFGVVFIGEYIQKLFFKAVPNIYDAYNSGIAGLITVIVYLSIYGFKFGYEIQQQEPKMFWYYGGWVLIAISTLIWVAKQFFKRLTK